MDCRDSNAKNNSKSNQAEWNEWLETISKFFSCYTVTSIRTTKTPNNLRPYAPIKINNLSMLGLLDSGSSVTILGNQSHLQFINNGFKLHDCGSLQFVAAGGQRLQPVGLIYLPISFENQTHVINTYIVPDISNNLILGMDFWTGFFLFPKHLKTIILCKPNFSLAELTADEAEHLCSYNHLTEPQKVTADHVIKQFRNISYEERGLGRTTLITHSIDTGDAAPIRQRYYRQSQEKQRLLNEQLDDMLKEDVVEPSDSPWSSPVLLTPKKNGELRFCLDSRKLNLITKKDAYSLHISEIMDNLRDVKYLTSIDLSKSFWQILIKEEDRCKTAFYIPSRGTFQFKCMPFGLTNAPATQQRLVDALFYGPEFEHMVFVYIDDIINVSPTFEKHIFLLLHVFEKLKSANLTINFKKKVNSLDKNLNI